MNQVYGADDAFTLVNTLTLPVEDSLMSAICADEI